MFVRLTCIQIIAAYRFRQGFPGTITSIPCISSKCNPFRVTWSLENPILDSYSAPMTKNSERFQPFKLDVCWILEIELLRFRGWNGILEFESRRNKSSTYFSFRTGKYFASQEAPFLLSRIKKPFMISIQMQEMDSKRSFSQANTNDRRTVCNKKVSARPGTTFLNYRIIYT